MCLLQITVVVVTFDVVFCYSAVVDSSFSGLVLLGLLWAMSGASLVILD